MRAGLHLVCLAALFVAEMPASAAVTINCFERVGGWCEQDGTCHSNTLRPAQYRIIAASLPVGSAEEKGTLRECRDGKCGQSWQVTLTSNGVDDILVRHGTGEFFQVHRTTGFFAHSTVVFSALLARVTYAFGTCSIR